ncbi:multiubiquitin domain-containing protein [Microbispora hainanensis]|uniref:Multiubiquitin domain-containing protein n=1 Tax=Microbispora hainanensis TaxID=568844 RepID=A0ABZ1SMA6_9ACTN|nr:multiubiquitin domain-containing protein [Microbispora hainanensis]
MKTEHEDAELNRPREYKIVVNTRPRVVTQETLSFEDVLALAFDPVPAGENWEFTVSYRHAHQHPQAGTLLPGQAVRIKNGTVFDATATDKS